MTGQNQAGATLESVLCTEELHRRPARAPDFEAENRALAALAQTMADSAGTILQSLAAKILEVCKADSAGVSLLTLDKQRFEWTAIAGAWRPHIGGGTPRDFGPCGDVLDRDTPLLFTHFERRYPYLLPAMPAAEECLLVPFYLDGKTVGTIWAIAHDTRKKFDAEDLRLLESLGRFASAAYQAVNAQHAELRYRALFTSIDDGFCVLERVEDNPGEPLDFRYVEANPAFTTQSGISDVLGKTIRQLAPSESEEWFLIYDKVCRTGTAIRFERALVKQGRLLELYAFRVEDGTQSRVAVVFKDITTRAKHESALRVSEIRYRRLFESAKDGILILDAETGKVVDANPFICELLGYPQEKLCDKELWEIGMFHDKAANQRAVKVLQENRYLRIERLQLHSTRGEPVEVEIVANAYREGDYRVIQCNIRDITERSRLERKTQEQAEALADLHNRKDEFLAMLSHELRTPLAAITNAVQFLNRTTNEKEVRGQARGIIERKVAHLKHLVDDLLEVSRITTGRVQLRLEDVVVNGIVDRAVETVRPLIAQRGHQLTVSLPAHPVWLNADAARLEQVVVNLLTNAAKYSEDGGHIWLTVKQEGEMVVMRARDRGVGIAPELLPHIFDLFTQAEPALDRSDGGLGVGLCLVQRLVELHGGTVTVSSVLGAGSEFVVRLPAPAASPAAPIVPAAEEVQLAEPRCRVLIVDDDEDTAESLAMLLQASGHDVRMAHDGPAALEAALDYRPDVMLLDIGLPMLNGFEVAERLRQQAEIRDTVLVAVTGYGQERDRQRTQQAGFDYHLVKPADFDDVQKILVTVAGQRDG
jgi:PAS domain S-box-containing protein